MGFISSEDLQWVNDTLKKIEEKMVPVTERNRNKIPYTTDESGRFDDRSDKKEICWWTNGFWGGEMWQLYKLTGNEMFKEEAIQVEEKLDAAFLNYNGMDHDAGFRWLPTAVINYKLNKGEEAKNRGLLAAASLAGRFNLNGNFIRAWNDWGDGRDTTGWAIIDCMMNLPLLYWASDVLADPRFKKIAMAHADTAMKNFIREDGSVRHIVGFDPFTGKFDREYGGQGYGEGSSWTRGQSWAVYGFALSYIHTGEKKYLETAIKVADYVLSEMPETFLVPIDYRQPKTDDLEDSTAAAITAGGLIEIAKSLLGQYANNCSETESAKDNNVATTRNYEHFEVSEDDKDRAQKYLAAAVRLLKALDSHSCDYTLDRDNLLTRGSVDYHGNGHHIAIIYGDYYYIEALMKLNESALNVF